MFSLRPRLPSFRAMLSSSGEGKALLFLAATQAKGLCRVYDCQLVYVSLLWGLQVF